MLKPKGVAVAMYLKHEVFLKPFTIVAGYTSEGDPEDTSEELEATFRVRGTHARAPARTIKLIPAMGVRQPSLLLVSVNGVLDLSKAQH